MDKKIQSEIISGLKGIIDFNIDTSFDDFEKQWGIQYTLNEFREPLKTCIKFARTFERTKWGTVPQDLAAGTLFGTNGPTFNHSITNLYAALGNIKSLKADNQLVDKHNQLKNNLKESITAFLRTYSALSIFATPADVSEAVLIEIDAHAAAAKAAAAAAALAAGKIGVSHYSGVYQTTLKNQRFISRLWLFSAAAFLAILIAGASYFAIAFINLNDKKDILTLIPEVVVMAIIFFISRSCITEYRAKSEKADFTQERIDALTCHDTFIASAQTPEIKTLFQTAIISFVFAKGPGRTSSDENPMILIEAAKSLINSDQNGK